jgi:hypothetical protein
VTLHLETAMMYLMYYSTVYSKLQSTRAVRARARFDRTKKEHSKFKYSKNLMVYKIANHHKSTTKTFIFIFFFFEKEQ